MPKVKAQNLGLADLRLTTFMSFSIQICPQYGLDKSHTCSELGTFHFQILPDLDNFTTLSDKRSAGLFSPLFLHFSTSYQLKLLNLIP